MRGAPRCAEGPEEAWSAWEWAQNRYMAMVGPWQYQYEATAGTTRYSTLLYPPGIPHPRYPPARTPPDDHQSYLPDMH